MILLFGYVAAIAVAMVIVRAVVNRRRQRENEDWKRYLQQRERA